MNNNPIGFSGYSSRNVSNSNTVSNKSNLNNNKVQTQNNSSFLDMDTLLKLLAAQLQNQDPMNPSSQDTYITQMSQMAMVQSITSMQQTSITTYAASLVGKEVTMAKYSATGDEVTEVVGTVTGVGFFANQPVIYVDGEPFGLTQLMAVGKLPAKPDKPEGGTGKPEGDNNENSEKIEDKNININDDSVNL